MAILIIDDVPVTRKIIKSFLEDGGYTETIQAESAEDAFKLLGLYADSDESHLPDIDLILMDVKMPVMSGLDATRKIKASKPELPIIAQTAYAMEDEKQHCLDAGCDDYIAKPIDPNDLFTLLKKYMNK